MYYSHIILSAQIEDSRGTKDLLPSPLSQHFFPTLELY